MRATYQAKTMTTRWAAAFTLGVAVTLGFALGAGAQENDAAKLLKTMSDYITNVKTISISYDSSIEVITPDLQKIQFNGSGKLLLERPDKLRATRVGGYVDAEIVFDGKTFTVLNRADETYAQSTMSMSVDQLINKLRNEYSLEAPGADLLISHPYNQLIAGVRDAKHIGRAVVDGIECEHLAFRNHDTDWQIWIETGLKPIPRKYVITSKTIAGAPQYTLVVRDWKSNVSPAANAFAFKSRAGAKKVELKQLADIDEVPPGVPAGAAQGEKK